MNKLSIILLAAVLSTGLAMSCGDNLKVTNDGKPADTGSGSNNNFPAAPSIGVQIDRLGRPAINTVLNHGFDGNPATAGSAKDAYNADGSPGGWQAAYVPTFMPVLAILDYLDTGYPCSNGTCSDDPTFDGCGDQVEYNGMVNGSGAAAANSYQTLAGLLADDELFLDTGKTICNLPNNQNYLGVEFNVLTTLTNTCGGRAPLNDVIDTTYTAIAIGVNGFNVTSTPPFTPAFGDMVGPHADVDDDVFPFLGAPTN
jgi:hypothetical protein